MGFRIIRDFREKYQDGHEIVAILDFAEDLTALGTNFAPGSKAYIPGGAEWEMGANGHWMSTAKILGEIMVVTLGTALTYNGNAQTQTVTSVKIGATTLILNTDYEISGNTATEPGVYVLTVAGKGSYAGSYVSVPYKVGKVQVTKPTTISAQTYNGSAKTVTPSGFNSTTMDISGNVQTNAGSYTAIVSLKDRAHSEWSDGSYDNMQIEWTINKANLTKPTKSANKQYTGSEVTVTLTNYNSSTMKVQGNKAIEVGNYTAVVEIKDPVNYKWSADDTTDPVAIAWSITKGTGTLSLSDSTKAMETGSTAEVTITTNSDGAITAVSSDATKATGVIEGKKLKITAVAAGSATITVSVAGTDHYTAPADKTCVVTVTDPEEETA